MIRVCRSNGKPQRGHIRTAATAEAFAPRQPSGIVCTHLKINKFQLDHQSISR